MFELTIVGLALFGALLRLGKPGLKHYLLACGLFTVPFSYDYTITQYSGVMFFQGWVGDVMLRLSDLFFLLIPVFCRRAAHTGDIAARRRMDWAVCFFVLMVLLSALFPSDRGYACIAVVQLALIVLLYYWVVTRYFSWKEDGAIILKCLAAAVLFQALLALWQAVFQDGYAFFRTGPPARLTLSGEFIRSQGTIPQPNGLASYLCLALLPLGAVWLLSKTRPSRLLLPTLVLGMAAILTTLSRGGWLGMFLGGGFILFAGGERRALRGWLLAGGVALLVILAMPQVHERLTGDDQGSAEDRWHLARIAMNIITDHPLRGVGINNYRIAMYSHIPKDYNSDFIYRVHTLPLLIWAEMGIGGLVAFLLLFWRGIRAGTGQLTRTTPEVGAVATGAAAACLAVFLHGFFDVVWTAPIINSQFFFTLGLSVLACQALTSEQDDAAATQPESETSDLDPAMPSTVRTPAQ